MVWKDRKKVPRMRSNKSGRAINFGSSAQWLLLLLEIASCARLAVGLTVAGPYSTTTRIDTKATLSSLDAVVQTHSGTTSVAQRVKETSSPLRRWILGALLTTVTTGTETTARAAADNAGAEVRGTPVTPFNSLMFQYRGNTFNGLSEQEIDEPSISYLDCCSKLKTGDVTFVEFLAPYGDVAYATLKSNNPNGQQRPIRVGAGYPIEQHDGYSSPAFAIRTVSNAGVPYKFTVPALSSSAKPKPGLAKLTK
jgi:hypothetical protein